MKRKVKSSKGFTLVETVAAITVLTLVVAAVTASLIASIRFNARTEQRLQAELAVSNAVERLLAEGVDKTVDTGDYLTGLADVEAKVDSKDDIYGYQVTVKSTSVDSICTTAYVHAAQSGGVGG